MTVEPHIPMSDSYAKSIIQNEDAFRKLLLGQPGEVIRLDSHGNCFDHDALVEANPESHVERIPGGTRLRPRKPWRPTDEQVKFCERLIDDIPIPRDKHSDSLDGLSYIYSALENYEKLMRVKLFDAEQMDWFLHGLKIPRWVMDDLRYGKVPPGERLTSCKDRTAIALPENNWTHASECQTTQPLPKMTRN